MKNNLHNCEAVNKAWGIKTRRHGQLAGLHRRTSESYLALEWLIILEQWLKIGYVIVGPLVSVEKKKNNERTRVA